MTGYGTGGTISGVARVLRKERPDTKIILCMLPDTGERYLSSPLFEGIPEAMTEEEMALSKSTPGFHMP